MFFFSHSQVVKLREVFPHGTSLVLAFEYMLSDLSEVIRNTEKPLTEGQVKSYMLMLLKGVAFCHENNIMHRVCIIIIYIYTCTISQNHKAFNLYKQQRYKIWLNYLYTDIFCFLFVHVLVSIISNK